MTNRLAINAVVHPRIGHLGPNTTGKFLLAYMTTGGLYFHAPLTAEGRACAIEFLKREGAAIIVTPRRAQ